MRQSPANLQRRNPPTEDAHLARNATTVSLQPDASQQPGKQRTNERRSRPSEGVLPLTRQNSFHSPTR